MEILTKITDSGETIYSVNPPAGTRIYPIGYFKSEEEAIEAYNKALESKK